MKAAGLFKAFDWYFLFFLWTYLVIGAWLYIKRYPNSVVPIHEGRFSTVAQALGVVAIVGLTPSVVFSFNNANAIFFVSIQMFLSGATLIALAPSVEAFIMKRKSLSSFYVLGLIVIGVAGYFRIKSATKEILLENLNTRILLSHTPQKPHKRFSLNKDIHTLLSGFQHLDDEVKEQPLYNTFEKLQKLDTATNRSGTLLLVQDYMDGNIIEGTQDLNCLEKSFLVPAIAGYAMVNGALYNCSIDTYGAIYYTYPGKDVDLSPKKVCERFGSSFHKILSYNVGRDSLVSFNCGNKSH